MTFTRRPETLHQHVALTLLPGALKWLKFNSKTRMVIIDRWQIASIQTSIEI